MTGISDNPTLAELDELERQLEAKGWTLVGFVANPEKDQRGGTFTAERPGTRVVSASATTSAGLLKAVAAREAHEAASKPDPHDERTAEVHDG